MKAINLKYSFALSFLVLILASNAIYGKPRIRIPEGIHFHQFASSALGPSAAWVNPAVLAADQRIYLLYAASYSGGSLTDDWGLSIAGDGIGICYRALNGNSGSKYREYIFSGGAKLWHSIFWGASYRYIKEGPVYYNKRHFWNIGLFLGQSRSFNVGAVFSNLNRSRVDGVRSLVEELYSFSYKTASNKLILSLELSKSTEQSFSDADYYYGLEYIPSPKLSIYAGLDEYKNYKVGVRFYFEKYFTGGQGYNNSETDNFDAILYIGTKFRKFGNPSRPN